MIKRAVSKLIKQRDSLLSFRDADAARALIKSIFCHCTESETISFIKADVISQEIDRGDAMLFQITDHHLQELSGNAFALDL